MAHPVEKFTEHILPGRPSHLFALFDFDLEYFLLDFTRFIFQQSFIWIWIWIWIWAAFVPAATLKTQTSLARLWKRGLNRIQFRISGASNTRVWHRSRTLSLQRALQNHTYPLEELPSCHPRTALAVQIV